MLCFKFFILKFDLTIFSENIIKFDVLEWWYQWKEIRLLIF